MNSKKIKNIFAFYKTTFVINISFSLFSLLIAGFAGFAVTFVVFGFLMSIAIKEVNNKYEYVFYYNNNVAKFELFFYCSLINISAVLLMKLIIFVW